MTTTRLEAFSDGVIAVIITIMVLELRAPDGNDLAALRPLLPVFLSYLISFVFIGIYWNNHHHLLHAARHINGAIMWANLHWLFWLSLTPFLTAWVGRNPGESLPAALYGVNLVMAAVAYTILARTIVAHEGRESALAKALGSDFKGNVSIGIYVLGVLLSFVTGWLSYAMYVLVALIWLIPDRRIEDKVKDDHHH
jgi:uncharacterized membrane protein